MNRTLNLSDAYIPNQVITLEDLALNYCNNIYSYLITILIFLLFYIIYRQELKQYFEMFINWINKSVDDNDLKRRLNDIPDQIEHGLGFFSASGVLLLLIFYRDYATNIQIVILYAFIGIFAIHRIIEVLQWIAKKIIQYYVKKQLGHVSQEMKDILKDKK